jgi:trimethylamine:corrinoid methyltransferase-like protein
MDGLEHIDFIAPVYARDIPEAIRDVKVLEMMIANTDKHVHMRAYSKKSLEVMIEMASIVAGGKESLKAPDIKFVGGADQPAHFP